MKKSSCGLTHSGIRIPKYKTKWMAPPKAKDADTSYSADNMLPSLYLRDPRMLLAALNNLNPTDVIEVAGQHGGETHDS